MGWEGWGEAHQTCCSDAWVQSWLYHKQSVALERLLCFRYLALSWVSDSLTHSFLYSLIHSVIFTVLPLGSCAQHEGYSREQNGRPWP